MSDRLLESSTVSYTAWIGLGVVLAETNRLKEAEQAYDKAYALKPDNSKIAAEILTNRSNVKSKQGDKQGALLDIQAAIQIDPNSALIWRSFGRLKQESRDYKSVAEAFAKVVNSEIAKGEDWAFFGEALEVLGEKTKAREALEKAEKLDPNNPLVLQCLFGYYGRNGNLQKTLDYINQALKIDSTSAVNWSSKGYTLLKLGQLPEAINALETATSLDPQFANAWINLGEAQMRSNNLGKAIMFLEKAISLAPSALDAHLFLAQSYLGSRQVEKARTHANVLLKAQPEMLQALTILTLTELMVNNNAAALTNYRKIQSKNPQVAQTIKAKAISQGLPGAQKLPD